MASNQKQKNLTDIRDDYEVKFVFDEDIDTQHCTDLSSSLIKRDHFQQQAKDTSNDNSKLSIQTQNTNNVTQKPNFSLTRKLSDPSHKFTEEQDELQDGFSEILVDPKALSRRQRFATNINLMAKSDVGFRMFTQEDDSNTSSLGSSMISNTSSQIGGGGTSSKCDKILVNLQSINRIVYDVNDFQKGPECCVCKSKFGVISLRMHHCRFCSLSVCQYCSDKRINSHRSCNICFVKIAVESNSCLDDPYINSFRSSVQYEKKYDKLVEEQQRFLQDQYQKMVKYCEDLSTKAWTMQIQSKQREKENQDQILELGIQLRDIQYDKTHQQQNIKNLKGILESKASHLDEKKKALYQLEQQLKRQTEDNLMKKQALDTKLAKLNRLKEKQEQLLQQNSIDNTTLFEHTKGKSIIDPDQIIDYNHFSTKKRDESGRTQSYYEIGRNSLIFNNDPNNPTYEQQSREQQEKQKRSQRCYTLQSDSYGDFEPKVHNVAPKKDKKGNFCVNKCDFN